MTKKYAERAVAILRAAGIEAKGINLFGVNGIAIRDGLFGESCYSWRSLRAAVAALGRRR
jgi:hypothetical protein